MNVQINTYDEIPYPNLTFFRTLPTRTAALASLFGIEPSDPHSARVLELGCAAGANLIPMAAAFPEAEFVGVDLSEKQIEEGVKTITAAGLNNISLQQENIVNIDGSWGKFDYIIAHGLFSWVPEQVQDHILRICRENLSASGVTYISYNVFPGWHARRTIRDLMLYHVAHIPEPKARIEQAKAILAFMAEHADPGFHKDMLKSISASLLKVDDAYLFHEFLERDNNPLLFTKFAEKAHAYGLQYLSDSVLAYTNLGMRNPKVTASLKQVSGDIVRLEQYLDFLENRSFRESLLVHDAVPIKRELDSKAIRKLWMWSTSKSDTSIARSLGNSQPIEFISPQGLKINLSDPIAKAAMVILEEKGEAPLRFSDLLGMVRARINSVNQEAADDASLCKFLLEAYNYSMLELIAAPWSCAPGISDKPRAPTLVRHQARSGKQIVSLRHIPLDSLTEDYLRLIELLDGEHTVDQLTDLMFEKLDLNKVPEEFRGIAHDQALLRSAFARHIRAILNDLAKLSLLQD